MTRKSRWTAAASCRSTGRICKQRSSPFLTPERFLARTVPLLPPVPALRPMPPVPGPALAKIRYDEDEDQAPAREWRSHHDRDDYPARICDEDGDDCRPAPRYRCDQDGDDCEYFGEDSASRGRGYDHQYDLGLPYYHGQPDFLAERQQVIAQLEYAQAQFHAARAAGDRKLSARWASYIRTLNHSLAALDARAAGAAYSFPPYMAAPPPAAAMQHPYAGYPPAAYPYAGYPNATGYSANPYGASPLSGVMSSLLGTMLGSGQIPWSPVIPNEVFGRHSRFSARARLHDSLRVRTLSVARCIQTRNRTTHFFTPGKVGR